MTNGRIFGTNKIVLATLLLFALGACTAKHEPHAIEVKEGNEQIQASATAANELSEKYGIELALTIAAVANGKLLTPEALAADYNWHQLTKAKRRGAKEKLAEFMTTAARTLEIDAKQGVYLSNKEALLGQISAARAYQKSLENFEEIFGEGYEPKNPDDQPKYTKTTEV